jgi:hypothetical protein
LNKTQSVLGKEVTAFFLTLFLKSPKQHGRSAADTSAA